MHRTRVAHQSKTREDIPSPRYDRVKRGESEFDGPGKWCHIHQVAPSPIYNDGLRVKRHDRLTSQSDQYQSQKSQTTTVKEKAHCHFCPRFHSQEPQSKRKDSKSRRPRWVEHSKSCHESRHKTSCTHAHSQSQSPYPGERPKDQERKSNDRHEYPRKVQHDRSESFDNPSSHRHPAPPSTYVPGTTLHRAHTAKSSSNTKTVRFEDDKIPESAGTHRPNCPIHHGGHSSDRHGRQSPQIRESRTFRWGWGPPLPEMGSPQFGGVYAERS